MGTVGQALVAGLAARGVDVVFGIPGVHTIEIYRGLAGSGIRHVTPRHEQAAGFMADGYARASGKPGVAFVITGPGVTNILTPMAQARADSVPMLVIAGVNPVAVQGKGLGHLHELPDQLALARAVAVHAEQVDSAADLGPALDGAFTALAGRGGPVLLQVPLDVMAQPCDDLPPAQGWSAASPVTAALPDLGPAITRLAHAARPVILAGGGANRADRALGDLARCLDAPVVLTANARGLMHGDALAVPASPSLAAVRALIAGADQVLAVGTELGPTDYDMFGRGGLPDLSGMVRIDIDAGQLARHRSAVTVEGPAGPVLAALADALAPRKAEGAARAAAARAAAWDEIGPEAQAQSTLLAALEEAFAPDGGAGGGTGGGGGVIVVGDSTQPVYAGNLYHDAGRPAGWFNAATGYGALGYGAPAAIGAALASPGTPVVCLTGDGGLQFSLAELMTARDAGADVTFLIWNNRGYGEIADAMRAAQVPVLGCDPTPPDFAQIARACGLPYECIKPDAAALKAALAQTRTVSGPKIIEVPVARRPQ